MATTEEMSLARKVLQLGMTITAQKRIAMHVEYSAHVDSLTVWDNSCRKGWDCNDNVIYLGDFHNDIMGKPTRKAVDQLQALIVKMDSLIERDEDGVPV